MIALTIVLIGVFERPPVLIKDDSILVVDLAMNITDSPEDRSFGEFFQDVLQADDIQTANLLAIVEAIDKAAEDSRIVGLFLKGMSFSENYGSGYPVLHEVRKSVENFKKSKKPVIAYLLNADIEDYFVASVADKIILDPFGQLDFKGMALEMMYFAETFKKYGIGVQVTKVGKYKSAIEPFIRTSMSDFEREQSTELLNEMWGEVLKVISAGRGIKVDVLEELSEKQALFLSSDAKKYKLVDEVEYRDQVFKYFDLERTKDEKEWTYNKVTLKKYMREVEQKQFLKRLKSSKPEIAIVYAEGDIVDGEGRSYQVGGNRLEKTLKEIREDDDIKAVVLRVNSPGGSALASEKIQRALRLVQQQKKPLVVSFGTYAASGGYWISCYADTIYTDPMTITGSIGVFGLIFNVQQIAKNYGVNFDRILTSPYAAINSFTQPKSPEELAKFQQFTNFTYNAFVCKVAEGRKMTTAHAAGIAQGRVWSGIKAKELGLADHFGGLRDAIKHAAKLAKIEDGWEIKQYPDNDKITHEILEHFKEATEVKDVTIGLFGRFIRRIQADIKALEAFNDPGGVYARMPFGFRLE